MKLRELTERLKLNLAKIKKITQAEGSSSPPLSPGGAAKKTAGKKEKNASEDGNRGTGEEQEQEGGSSWREAGGILDDMKGGINVNLKDVKVPEFDVSWVGVDRSGRGGRRR